ncbi:MAG: acyl-CoA-binding protein [Gilvibacter sp.]
MKAKELDKAFEEAVNSINEHTDPFPADFLLRLYAYYKRATNNPEASKSSNPLIAAFKTNALFQTKDLNPQEAKQQYVDAVNHYFLYRK